MKTYSIRSVQVTVISKLYKCNQHVFYYSAFGFYCIANKRVYCLVGFDKNKNCIGLITIPSSDDSHYVLCMDSEYRSDIDSTGLKTAAEWKRKGYRLKDDASGDMLYISRKCNRILCYYGRNEVEKN